MPLDTDVINEAMDRAEARQLDETAEAIETEVTDVPQETIANDPLEDAATQKASEERTQAKTEATKSARERDGSGKFQKSAKEGKNLSAVKAKQQEKKNLSAQDEANVETSTEGEEQVEENSIQVEATVEAPAYWDAKDKLAFAKAPKDVQKIIATKEAQRNQWANRIATETQRTRELEKQLNETYEPHKAKLAANGIKNIAEASSRLLAWNELLESDTVGTINTILRRNGLPPYDPYGNGYAEQEQQYSQDPRVEQALAEAQEAKKLAEEHTQRYQRQEEERFISTVNSFKNGKDSRGQVRRPFAEAYAPQITQVTEEIQRQRPDLTIEQAMHYGYEYTMSHMAKLHGPQLVKPQLPQQTREQKIAQAQRAKAARSSSVGAPRSGVNAPRQNAKTIDEAMDRAEERLSSH